MNNAIGRERTATIVPQSGVVKPGVLAGYRSTYAIALGRALLHCWTLVSADSVGAS